MQKTVKAYAKINLFLSVLGKLPNGYHELETVMQSVSLHDIITVKKTASGINVRFDLENLNGGENTVTRAAEEFFAAAEIHGGAEIYVQKKIPLASGMGGGSADAAAVINCLNELYGYPLGKDEVIKTALLVGADVPFCIEGSAALCGGVGEKITKINNMPKCFLVLAINDHKKSTAEAYSAIDSLHGVSPPNSRGLQDALDKGNLGDVGKNLYNTFAEVVNKDKLDKITQVMRECGAVGCNLSGAGPTVFGIFGNESAAYKCVEILKTTCRFAVVCTPMVCGCEQAD